MSRKPGSGWPIPFDKEVRDLAVEEMHKLVEGGMLRTEAAERISSQHDPAQRPAVSTIMAWYASKHPLVPKVPKTKVTKPKSEAAERVEKAGGLDAFALEVATKARQPLEQQLRTITAERDDLLAKLKDKTRENKDLSAEVDRVTHLLNNPERHKVVTLSDGKADQARIKALEGEVAMLKSVAGFYLAS